MAVASMMICKNGLMATLYRCIDLITSSTVPNTHEYHVSKQIRVIDTIQHMVNFDQPVPANLKKV